MKQICITGCGCSGTKYITKVFELCSVDIGHEKAKSDGLASWYVAVGRTNGYIPFRSTKFQSLKDPVVFHQVRHPLAVISTFQRAATSSWRYIYRELTSRGIDFDMDMPLIERCMLYWYHWNLLAGELASFRYRIENLPKVWKKICFNIGRGDLFHLRDVIGSVPKTVNSHTNKYTPLSWRDLNSVNWQLAGKIKNLGRSYGYDEL